MFTRFQAGPDSLVIELTGSMPPISPDTPGAQFMVALGDAYQCETVHHRRYLLDMALQLQDYIAENAERLGHRFIIEACAMGQPALKSSSEHGFSGFRIDGVVHRIHGGIGECVLTRYEPFPDGSGSMQQRIDVRDRKRLDTDDWGEIKIRRRKVKYTLPDKLPDVIAFLERVQEKQVKLSSYDKPPSLRELLQAFSEGGGADDWAIEELGRQGAAGRMQLVEALENRGLRKYLPATVQLLLLLHPGQETDDVLQHVLDAQSDGPDKTGLMTLIVAYQRATDQDPSTDGNPT